METGLVITEKLNYKCSVRNSWTVTRIERPMINNPNPNPAEWLGSNQDEHMHRNNNGYICSTELWK